MKRLLLVDEDPQVRASLQQLFEKSGYETLMAENGPEALRLLEDKPVDIVISELQLPMMDGYQFLSKVKDEHPQTIRIMLSGLANEKMVLRAMQRSVVKIWVSKPWDDSKILQLVKKLLETETILSEKKLMGIINGVDTLPTIQSRYLKIMDLIEGDADLGAIATEIEKDPSIATKVLHIINSAFFNLHTGSIKHAVTYLGLQNIRNIIISTSVIDAMSLKGNSLKRLEFIWNHSFLTNQIVNFIFIKVLGKNLQDISATAGLLHNIGSIFFLKYYDQKYLHVLEQSHVMPKSLIELEEKQFNVTHQETGGYLLQWWGLPYPIVEAALYHHTPLEEQVINRELVAVVHIAQKYAEDKLDKKLTTEVDSEVFQVVGVTKEEFENKFANFEY